MRKNNLIYTAITVVVMTLVISSCTTSRYSASISSYSESVTSSSALLSSYYSNINTVQRKAYLESKMLKKEEVFQTVGGKPTPLIGVFEIKSIEVRMSALKLLAAHAKGLQELAATTSPQSAQDSINATTASLSSAAKTIGTSGDGSAYIAPAGQIVALFGRGYLEGRRDETLRKEIINTKEPVRRILKQVDRDLNRLSLPLDIAANRQRLSEWEAYYNANRATLSLDASKRLLDQVETLTVLIEAGQRNNAGKLIAAISESHDQMVTAAETGRDPDLANFNASVADLAARVKELSAAAEAIRKAGE